MSAPVLTQRPPVGVRKLGDGRVGRRIWGLAEALFLGISALLALFPLVLLLSTAVKNPSEAKRDPFGLFTSIEVTNVVTAWTVGGFDRYFANSVIISMLVVVIAVPLATCAGYAFAKLDFPAKEWIFRLFLVGLLTPFFALMVPVFYILKDLNLLGSYWAVVIPLVTGANGMGAPAGLAFGILLMRSAFISLPSEIVDAARVDGCSEWQIFTRVMLPLSMPGVASLAVLTFLAAWNSFLVPLLYVTDPDKQPLPLALNLLGSGRTAEIGPLAAGALLMVIPVVVVFLIGRRALVRGLLSGSVK